MKHLDTLIDQGQLTDPDSAKGRLLSGAAHLFREKGYERTTVRDIANEIGIQSGSLFHHYKSKEEILKAVMTDAVIYNTEKMRAAVAGPRVQKSSCWPVSAVSWPLSIPLIPLRP
ncbi:TetR/AcrR family transcriptional regulator [Oceanicoccus sagamiensis]|uniref:TetR/AcrR family transcriptional regulator n=1 Tax=Oceanicoccus sagamiensis TaxID=716816 RepID=UPI0023E3BD3E|nr:helix-turn-helix domain-containing protein [Oceanicoccus sagamiensis]